MMLRTTSLFWLSAVLLADVAPSGSCNRAPENVDVTFVLTANDCSCLPATVTAIATGLFGAPRQVELRCGASSSFTASVQPSGLLTVVQPTPPSSKTWLEARYSAVDGGQVSFALSCPAR
jgi:hypothetical protein